MQMNVLLDMPRTNQRPKSCRRFHFPLNKPELLTKWTSFVNRNEWKATSRSVLCDKHFAENVIKRRKQDTLKWNLSQIPTIHTKARLQKSPSFQAQDKGLEMVLLLLFPFPKYM